MRRLKPGIMALLIANVVLFVAVWFVTRPAPTRLDPISAGLALWFPGHPNFGVWQFATHLFMHGGLAHLLFNMFALYSFGPVLERLWGTHRFLTFFLLCGIGAGLIQTGLDTMTFQHRRAQLIEAGLRPAQVDAMVKTGFRPPAATTPELVPVTQELLDIYHARLVGASGAVYGVLVAFVLMFPNIKLGVLFIPVGVAAKYLVPLLLLVDVIGATTGAFSMFRVRIAHAAHLGGALIGLLLMWYWRRRALAAGKAQNVFTAV